MSGANISLSPLKAARREKIIDAAERMFLSYGFRGTTVEGIAEAAGISKVTLYAYFHAKDAAFEAVAARFFETLRTAAMAALGGPGRRSARVAAALIAKHGILFDTVRASPHAAELLAARAKVDRALRCARHRARLSHLALC